MDRLISALLVIVLYCLPMSTWGGQLQTRFTSDIRTRIFTQTNSEAYHKQLNLRLPGRKTPYQTFDAFSAVLPKNLRVKFTMTSISNQVVSGEGVNANIEIPADNGSWVLFDSYSETADLEIIDSGAPSAMGNYAIPLPAPGMTFQLDAYYVIYDALVFDGCGNLPYFPINFKSIVRDFDNDAEILGEFSSYDNTSLIPNGYWHFDYVIRAMDSNGDESDFSFAGLVEVLCSNLEDYE